MAHIDASTATLVGVLREAGGWWSAVPPDELLDLFTDFDDAYCRAHFTRSSGGDADAYARMRPAYMLGHLAGIDPEYTSRGWSEIEPELARTWAAATDSPWAEAAGPANASFARASAAKAYGWRAR